MDPLVIATTDRIIIRTLNESDASFLADLHSRSQVTAHLTMNPSTGVDEERAQLAHWDELFGEAREFGVWGLEAVDHRLIGLVMLKEIRPLADHDGYDVGWRLHPDVWGQGYATEAGGALIKLGFNSRGLDAVYAAAMPSNLRSRAVAERLGMKPTGRLPFAGSIHELYVIHRH